MLMAAIRKMRERWRVRRERKERLSASRHASPPPTVPPDFWQRRR